jgi:hypothetical protein
MGRYFRSKHLLSEFALKPEFIEWRGCVLLKDGVDQRLLVQFNNETPSRTIEMLINRRHVTDFFINPPTAAPADLLYEVGVMVRDIWKAVLKAKFPDRRFEIYFEYALPVAEITFYQVTDETALQEAVPYIVHTT